MLVPAQDLSRDFFLLHTYVLVGLNRYTPFTIYAYVVHNQRIHFFSLAPFGLHKQHATRVHLCSMHGRPLQVRTVENNGFELMCLPINCFQWLLEFLRGKCNPVPNSSERMCSTGFNMCSYTQRFQSLCQGQQIVHGWLATSNYHQGCAAGLHIFHQICHLPFGMYFGVPTLLHIAPYTTHIAATQTYEIRRMTRKSTLTLNGVKLLHYWYN